MAIEFTALDYPGDLTEAQHLAWLDFHAADVRPASLLLNKTTGVAFAAVGDRAVHIHPNGAVVPYVA